jgi:hypothetical protein
MFGDNDRRIIIAWKFRKSTKGALLKAILCRSAIALVGCKTLEAQEVEQSGGPRKGN